MSHDLPRSSLPTELTANLSSEELSALEAFVKAVGDLETARAALDALEADDEEDDFEDFEDEDFDDEDLHEAA